MVNNKDFEQRYFDKMDESVRDIKNDFKEVKDETRKHFLDLGRRLKKVEDKVFPTATETIKQLPPIWRDPQVIKLLTYLVIFGIIMAVIIAGLKGVDLPDGIFG